MTEAKAHLNSYRQSPRKMRIVADIVRGQSPSQAIDVLSFVPKRAALPLKKLIASALANAKNLKMSPDNLIIKELKVNEGATLYRRRPRSKGMSNPIRKRTSHITVTLSDNKQLTMNKKKESKDSLSIVDSKS